MRILHLTYSLSSGGAEKMASLLANAQARLGHEVCVMQLTGVGTPGALFHRADLLPEVRHVSAGMDSGLSLRTPLRVGHEISHWKPDVIHMHSNALPYLWHRLIVDSVTRRRSLPPIVWTMHNVPSRAAGSSLQRRLDSLWLRSGRVSAVTLSDTCAREFERLYGHRPPVVANGLPRISPTEAFYEVSRMIGNLRKSKDTRIFIHAARFHPNKCPERLFKAFRCLEEEGTDFALVVIGRGWDSPEAMSLRPDAPRGLHIVGEVSNPEDYIRAADALCLSSDFEGMPLCVIEALSCGVTPVCTPAGGIPDMIKDGVTGFLSDALTTDALTEALRRYLRQPIDQKKLISVYREKYTLDRCVESYMGIYGNCSRSRR